MQKKFQIFLKEMKKKGLNMANKTLINQKKKKDFILIKTIFKKQKRKRKTKFFNLKASNQKSKDFATDGVERNNLLNGMIIIKKTASFFIKN